MKKATTLNYGLTSKQSQSTLVVAKMSSTRAVLNVWLLAQIGLCKFSKIQWKAVRYVWVRSLATAFALNIAHLTTKMISSKNSLLKTTYSISGTLIWISTWVRTLESHNKQETYLTNFKCVTQFKIKRRCRTQILPIFSLKPIWSKKHSSWLLTWSKYSQD